MEIGEILESLWRLYSSENGDFQACRGCSRWVPKAGGALQKQSSRQVGGSGLAGGEVRGGKPPQGTGGRTYNSIDAMYPLDTADLVAPRTQPGRVMLNCFVARSLWVCT